MTKPIIYTRRDEPSATQRSVNAVWKIILFLFLLMAIESLFYTIPIGYHIFMASRKSHVHTNSHSH
jgi:hypothetical protein